MLVKLTTLWTNVPRKLTIYLHWAATRESVPSGMCTRRKLRSACESAQSISVPVVHMKKLCSIGYPKYALWIFRSIREVWSKSLMDAHVRRYVFWRCDSITNTMPHLRRNTTFLLDCMCVSAQADQSPLSAWRRFWSLPYHRVPCEDWSDCAQSCSKMLCPGISCFTYIY